DSCLQNCWSRISLVLRGKQAVKVYVQSHDVAGGAMHQAVRLNQDLASAGVHMQLHPVTKKSPPQHLSRRATVGRAQLDILRPQHHFSMVAQVGRAGKCRSTQAYQAFGDIFCTAQYSVDPAEKARNEWVGRVSIEFFSSAG